MSDAQSPDYAIPAPATATQIGGAHYRQLVIQPAEFSEKNGLSFLEGCIVKRICRYRRKDGAQDLLKARHEIDLLMQFHYPEHSTATASNPQS